MLTTCTSLKVSTKCLYLDLSKKKIIPFSPGASPFMLSQAKHPLLSYDNNNCNGVRVWGLYIPSGRTDREMLDVHLFLE